MAGGGVPAGAAAIFADFIERVDRNIHLVIVRIDDSDHFLIAVARRNPNQTAELADTEVYMHDYEYLINEDNYGNKVDPNRQGLARELARMGQK